MSAPPILCRIRGHRWYVDYRGPIACRRRKCAWHLALPRELAGRVADLPPTERRRILAAHLSDTERAACCAHPKCPGGLLCCCPDAERAGDAE